MSGDRQINNPASRFYRRVEVWMCEDNQVEYCRDDQDVERSENVEWLEGVHSKQ